MKITVIGTGYVGLVSGLGFAHWGHEVACLDTDEQKIKTLQSGVPPIYEPGIDLFLKQVAENGSIFFTSDKKAAIEFGDVIFIATGTPELGDGKVDLTYVHQAARDIATYMQDYKLIADKSTVPVGTAKEVTGIVKETLNKLGKECEFDVASNPEFMREGKALQDFMNPDRIVLGVSSQKSENLLKEVYRLFEHSAKPIIVCTPETAEMIKYASNAFLATKITFINEIANLCEKVGANALEVAHAMGKDERISPQFLRPGPGLGGSCFPKDAQALAETGRLFNARITVVESVIEANKRQKLNSALKVFKICPPPCTLAILGLSFKPDTDDVRQSPAIEVVRHLSELGDYVFKLYDPQAMACAKKEFEGIGSSKFIWCERAAEAVEASDAVVVLTEWAEFSSLDMQSLIENVKQKTVFDFRNVFNAQDMKKFGYNYYATGITEW